MNPDTITLALRSASWDSEEWPAELVRILRDLADDIDENGGASAVVLDSNGEPCGSLSIAWPKP